MISRFSSFSWRRRAAVLPLRLALAACGGGSNDAKAAPTTTKQKVAVPGAHVTLSLVGIDVESAGPAVQLNNATRGAVMSQTRKYVELAVVKPLLTGKRQAAFNALFAPPVAAQAVTTDRSALTDDAVGKVAGGVRAPNAKVTFTALADGSGNVLYVASRFGLAVSSKVDARPLKINRIIELTFQKTNGKWLIAAYRVTAVRTLGTTSK